MDWGTDYKVYGDWVITDTDNNQTRYVRLGDDASTVVPIAGDPQPTPPLNKDPEREPDNDILGWGFIMASDRSDNYSLFKSLMDLLPEEPGVPHSALENCWGHLTDNANNKFDASWMAVGAQSTLYIGEDDETTSTVPSTTTSSSVITDPPLSNPTATRSTGSSTLNAWLHSRLAVWVFVCHVFLLTLVSWS